MPSFLETEGADDLTESNTCPFCCNRTITSSSQVPSDHIHHRRTKEPHGRRPR